MPLITLKEDVQDVLECFWDIISDLYGRGVIDASIAIPRWAHSIIQHSQHYHTTVTISHLEEPYHHASCTGTGGTGLMVQLSQTRKSGVASGCEY